MMRAVLIASVAASAGAVGPIQKILELLNNIKSKVNAEGEVEAEQFDAYSKWCTEEIRQAGFDIDTATSKSEDLSAEIQEQSATIGEADADIAKLSASIQQNEGDLSSATALRASENKDFSATEKDLVDTIDALVRAASILRRAGHEGSSGSGAQLKAALNQVATTMSVIMDAASISSEDKSHLAALVQAGTEEEDGPSGAPQAAAYESHSTSIVDTLAELKVKAEQELADARKEEANRKHNFQMLAQSLSDQISTENKELTKAKGTKSKSSEVKASAEGDLAATTTKLNETKTYKGDTEVACQTKANEWAARQESRKEELSVIQKAIEILSADDFTAASSARLPSLMQIRSTIRTKNDVRQEVASLLQAAANKYHSVALSQLAMRTRAGDDPFSKVKGLISDMINTLTQQAAEESNHNAWCNEENKASKAKRDNFMNKVSDYSARIDAAEAGVAKLKEEIAGASAELKAMAQSMSEATKIRNDEAAEYKAAMADYATSLEAIGNAISVLSDYFAAKPALIQAPAPVVFEGAYKSKTDSAGGVIAMLEVAESDFARMEAEARTQESAAQKAFNKMSQENDVRKATLETEVKSKEAESVRVTNLVSDLKSDRAGAQSELDATLAYIEKLKESCEHKPMSFAERAARRQAEIDSLKNALDILENETAGTSLLQRSA